MAPRWGAAIAAVLLALCLAAASAVAVDAKPQHKQQRVQASASASASHAASQSSESQWHEPLSDAQLLAAVETSAAVSVGAGAGAGAGETVLKAPRVKEPRQPEVRFRVLWAWIWLAIGVAVGMVFGCAFSCVWKRLSQDNLPQGSLIEDKERLTTITEYKKRDPCAQCCPCCYPQNED